MNRRCLHSTKLGRNETQFYADIPPPGRVWTQLLKNDIEVIAFIQSCGTGYRCVHREKQQGMENLK